MDDQDDHRALATALGIEPGARVAVVNEPEGWLGRLLPLPAEARLFERASEPLDVIVYFSDERANVERRVPALGAFLAAGGALWSAVPDASDELSPSVVEEAGRRSGLHAGGTLEIAQGWIATRLVRRDSQQSDATSG